MVHTKLKKGMALLCVVLSVGTVGCKQEMTGRDTTDEMTGVQDDGRKDAGEQITPTVTGSANTGIAHTIDVDEAIAAIVQNEATEFTKRTAVVKLSDEGIEINGTGCEADENSLNIKEAGVYEISGRLSDGSIYINADNESEVQLILNGAEIHNETGAAIYCKKAKKVTITLAEGSSNTLSDGMTYEFADEADEPDATLFAKHDLVLNGSGKLIVTSSYGDAIKGKDSLYILGGELVVNAADDGIVGKDFLYIADGSVSVNAAADAVKSTNDTDTSLGNIRIDGGNFSLTAGTDGIQADNVLLINGGKYSIISGGGSANASVKTEEFGFGGGKEWGKWGNWNTGTETEEDETSSSAKGLKAGTDLIVTGGQFDLDTSDDALHGNTSITISGGEFLIASGDDGMHADETLLIEGDCKVQITKSYEGIEAQEIVINGGNITITASDDGLNAAGGADGSGFGRPGAGTFGGGKGELTINGGAITVDATGDGLDSNGNLTMNGGTVCVFGPISSMNGVLDFNGTFCLNGGTLLAVGSSGMAQIPSDTSGQNSLAAVLDSQAQAGSSLEILVDGVTVLTTQARRQFNFIVASSKDFVKGSEAAVIVNGKECYAGALTDVVTCFGDVNAMGGFGGDKGNKGDRPGFSEGELPQRPDGNAPQWPNGDFPQRPDGNTPQWSDGELPQRPEEEKPET